MSLTEYSYNSGKDYANEELSQKLADASKAYLLSKGIEADRVSTAGLGSQQPIADNKTTDEKAKNTVWKF